MKCPAILFATLGFIFTDNVTAQTNSQPSQWRKTTTRTVAWAEPEDKNTLSSPLDKSTDKLTMMLVNSIEKQIVAYAADDYSFSKQLSKFEKASIFLERIDTIAVYDPVLGEEIKQVVKVPFAHWDIKHFKIVESWQTVPSSGLSTVQTIGIIPMIDLYSDDGLLMGRKPLVLFKYSDILPILKEYEQYHPENSPFVKFWNGQFEKEGKQDTEENTSK